MIAHIDPNSKQALIVSFPRDLMVNVPGGCRSRINATYNGDFRCNSHSQFGGPQLIVDTLKLNFNIDINHYVEVNFAGFRQMVDVLGTVPIYFPAKARDVKTGLYVDGGCQNLTGIESLNYVRSRYYEYWDYQTGHWVQQGLSDLGRIKRQQYFIRTLMQTAINKGARDPFTAMDFATKMARSVAIDQNFSETDLKRLIRTFRFTSPGAVQMLTVPTVASRAVSGALELAPDADTVLSLLRKFAPPPPPPAKLAFTPEQVKVEVRDASGTVPASTSTTGSVPGSDWVTERASSILGRIGFPVAIGPRAALSHQTVLQFTAKTAGKALVLAAHMSGTPKLELVPKIVGGADVVLFIGRPGSQLIDPDAPPTTTTTTTVAPPANSGTTTTTEPPNPGTPPPGTPASSVKSQWIGCE
jgi:LCP family protein required for cell wall assembly